MTHSVLMGTLNPTHSFTYTTSLTIQFRHVRRIWDRYCRDRNWNLFSREGGSVVLYITARAGGVTVQIQHSFISIERDLQHFCVISHNRHSRVNKLRLLNGFSFLVIFFFFILGRAVD